MSDSILNIIINTVKKGGGDKEAVTGLKKMSASFKELTGFSLGSVTAIGAVAGAGKAVIDVIKKSIEVTVEYGNQVQKLSQISGESAENSSRMIQVADDLRVNYDSLTKSMIFATTNGFDVSNESIAKMSDEYLKLAPGMERVNYLADRFGKRNGVEMAKVLELGSEKLKEKMATVESSLILDEKAIVSTVLYQQAVDGLEDSITGLNVYIGKKLLPQLDLFIRTITPGTDEVEKNRLTVRNLNQQITALEKNYGFMGLTKAEAQAQIQALRQEIEGLDQDYIDLANQQMLEIQEQSRLNETLNEYKTIMGGSFGNEVEKFNGKLADQRDKAAEIQARIDELNGKSWLTEEQKQELADLKQNLIDNAIETGKLRDEHDRTMKTMAMNMMITKASSDGLTDTEVTNIGKIMVQWGLWDAKTAEVVENINGINLDQAEVELDTINQALGRIFSQPDEKRIRVITEYITQGDPGTHATGSYGTAEQDAGVDFNGNGVIGAANGLDFMVPAGFPNDSYALPLAVTSGERVQVTPAGQATSGIVNHFYISGAGDPDAVANRVIQKIRLQLGLKK